MSNLKEPLFIKDFSKNNEQLSALEELSLQLVDNWKKGNLDKDIRLMKYGLDGENSVYYELKNSFLPILCLHNIRLEYKDYVAQLDFVVVTEKFILVVESKNLVGDLRITHEGSFIRELEDREEGMYSPITQNDRHVNILKALLSNTEYSEVDVFSVIVLTNAKTILNKIEAPGAIAERVIKIDQLVPHLKEKLNASWNKGLTVAEMKQLSSFLLKEDKPIVFDNIAKYSITPEDYRQGKKKADPKPKQLTIDDWQEAVKLEKEQQAKEQEQKVKVEPIDELAPSMFDCFKTSDKIKNILYGVGALVVMLALIYIISQIGKLTHPIAEDSTKFAVTVTVEPSIAPVEDGVKETKEQYKASCQTVESSNDAFDFYKDCGYNSIVGFTDTDIPKVRVMLTGTVSEINTEKGYYILNYPELENVKFKKNVKFKVNYTKLSKLIAEDKTVTVYGETEGLYVDEKISLIEVKSKYVE